MYELNHYIYLYHYSVDTIIIFFKEGILCWRFLMKLKLQSVSYKPNIPALVANFTRHLYHVPLKFFLQLVETLNV